MHVINTVVSSAHTQTHTHTRARKGADQQLTIKLLRILVSVGFHVEVTSACQGKDNKQHRGHKPYRQSHKFKLI